MRLHGMVFLPREDSGLPRDSVVSLTHLVTVNKVELGPAVGEVSTEAWRRVRDAFDEMLGSRRGRR
jgi:mRNA interferase MazF